MPFELGLDHGCRLYGDEQFSQKAILILEHTKYDYQKALSDIAGWDIQAHKGDYISAVRVVSLWLQRQANATKVGATKILSNYVTFQEWYWKRELAAGSSEDDITAYPTVQVVEAMVHWIAADRPE